ncbi:MAG: hypothetical protein WCB67_07825, partial [Solirubrobacteraceae bacterium]
MSFTGSCRSTSGGRSLAQTTRLLSDAALVIGVKTFGELDLPRVPPVPLARLVASDEHDRVAVGVEREQNPHAAIDPYLLELV